MSLLNLIQTIAFWVTKYKGIKWGSTVLGKQNSSYLYYFAKSVWNKQKKYVHLTKSPFFIHLLEL